MRFNVRALTQDRTMTELFLEAPDEAEARRLLEIRGMQVSSISQAEREFPGFRLSSRGRFSLLLFSQELLSLLNAGLSIVEGLEALREKEENETMRSILDSLLTGLRNGKRFSSVLAEQSDFFTPLYIGMIRAAEGTSDLPRSLERYIDYQKRVDLVRNKIVSASIYPIILALVGSGVTFFLIAFVVPRFANVYRDTGRELPWLSRLLMETGQFVTDNFSGFLLGLGCFAIITLLSLRRGHLAGTLARVMDKLPGLGERRRIYELSRLYLTLGMLSEGGIPLVAAMDTAQEMASPDIRAGLRMARTSVQSGSPLSSAFEANGLTTPISLRMLRVGERSGELGKMLTQSASFYDDEINRWTDRFTRIFEPLLMSLIGLVVGAIVVLLYMPIFDLAGSLS